MAGVAQAPSPVGRRGGCGAERLRRLHFHLNCPGHDVADRVCLWHHLRGACEMGVGSGGSARASRNHWLLAAMPSAYRFRVKPGSLPLIWQLRRPPHPAPVASRRRPAVRKLNCGRARVRLIPNRLTSAPPSPKAPRLQAKPLREICSRKPSDQRCCKRQRPVCFPHSDAFDMSSENPHAEHTLPLALGKSLPRKPGRQKLTFV
jgi:hypothetical protein